MVITLTFNFRVILTIMTSGTFYPPLVCLWGRLQAHVSRKSKRLIHESVTRCVTRCQVTRGTVEHVIRNSMGNEIWSIYFVG